MHASYFLVLFFFSSFVSLSFGAIPSFGSQTATEIRNKLKDSDYRIRVRLGVLIQNENFTSRVADLKRFPVLAGQDVQTQIASVVVKAGKPFIKHYHPRAAEILNLIKGKLRVELTTEGVTPGVISNILLPGESTVFPQGLIHDAFCLSKTDCHFNVVFTSADPGFVGV